MTEYCKKCGRPLPADGICPCTRRRSRPFERPSGPIVGAFKRIVKLFLRYWRNPVGTSRLAAERRDMSAGISVLLLAVLFSMLSTLSFTLRYVDTRFAAVAPRWLIVGFFAPLLAMLLTVALFYALTSVSRMRVDVREVVAALGVNAVFPVTLMALSVFLSLIHFAVFDVLAVLTMAAWVITFFTTVFQTFAIKLNLLGILILIPGFAAGYFALSRLLGWLVDAAGVF